MPSDFPRPELKAQEVERDDREVATPVRVLAVDDLRLVRMQRQLARRKAVRQRTPQQPRLLDSSALGSQLGPDL
jgi:hypothetical protein